MIRARHEITIRRPPDQVFRYFADLRNEPEWNRGHVRNVVMTTPDPIGLGTTFVGDHPGFGRATWRIVDFVPSSRIALEGKVGSGTYRYVGEIFPQNGGALFVGTVIWQPGSPLKLLAPLLSLILKLQARRSFNNLRAELERAA
jgi:uncharacterized protein YndB with AHSA1/START domain